MQIKKYQAVSIQEILIMIRRDMGEDAVILSTKRLKGGNRPMIEVTAARDNGNGGALPSVEEPSEIYAKNKEKLQSNPVISVEEITSLMKEIGVNGSIRRELADMKHTLNTFIDLLGLRSKVADRLSGLYYHLISIGMSEERARRLMNLLHRSKENKETSQSDQLEFIEALIMESVPKVHRGVPDFKKAVALIGPTGVGKTTTLAKLAARYAMKDRLKVGLITTDTFRIAAVEQLKIYAKIMGLPLEVASDGDAFRKAVKKLADKEIILIDTPGTSQKDVDHLLKLRGTIGDEQVETNLLLSPTTSRENMLDTAERFAVMGYGGIIFTKLDECVGYGQIYDVIDHIGKPVSYFTYGQNVPQDIETADPAKIAKLIIRNKLN